MKKFALFSMMAVLAASCSSDIILDELSATGQQSVQENIPEQINSIISKTVTPVYEGSIFEAAALYSEFADELYTRDNSNFPFAFYKVPKIENGKLTLDFGKVEGQFIGERPDGRWAYRPAEDTLKFNFVHYDGGMPQKCELDVCLDSESDCYSIRPNSSFEILIPKFFNETMLVDGAVAGYGAIWTTMFDNMDRTWGTFSGINITREFANIGMFYEGYLENSLFMPNVSKFFSIYDISNPIPEDYSTIPYEELLSVEKYIVNGAAGYRIAIGDVRFDNAVVGISMGSESFSELAEILAANLVLARGEETGLDELKNRIDEFNAKDSVYLDFWADNDSILKSALKLVLEEPNAVYPYSHVRLAFTYSLNGQVEETVIEAPIESLLLDINAMLESLHNEVVSYFEAQYRAIRGFIENTINNIERSCIAVRNHLGDVSEWIAKNIGLKMEWLAGLAEVNGNFIDELLEYLGEYLGQLDDYFDSLRPVPANC